MWKTILEEIAKIALLQAMQVIGTVFLVIILLVIGLIVSGLIKRLVVRALKRLGIDGFSSSITLKRILEKGGIGYSISELIGMVFYWFTFLLALVIILNATGLTIAADLFNRVVLYMPNVIAAIFILLLGIFFAGVLNNFVKTVAVNAGTKQGNVLGKIVEVVVITFVIIMTLEQLKIKVEVVELAIGIVLGSIGLAFAIAVGLGCKDIIQRLIIEAVEKNKCGRRVK